MNRAHSKSPSVESTTLARRRVAADNLGGVLPLGEVYMNEPYWLRFQRNAFILLSLFMLLLLAWQTYQAHEAKAESQKWFELWINSQLPRP